MLICHGKGVTNSIQVNKKFRKFESEYRDCIKRNGDKIGTQTCYEYQRNIMGTSIYHNICLCPNLVSVSFYAIPMFPFKFPIYLVSRHFFLDLGTCIVYLVANVY